MCTYAFHLTDITCSAAKGAKGLLKNERMNLILWGAYANIERDRGNVEEVSCRVLFVDIRGLMELLLE